MAPLGPRPFSFKDFDKTNTIRIVKENFCSTLTTMTHGVLTMEDKVCCRYCEKLVSIGSKHQCQEMISQGQAAQVADEVNRDFFVSRIESEMTENRFWSKFLVHDDNDSDDDDTQGGD